MSSWPTPFRCGRCGEVMHASGGDAIRAEMRRHRCPRQSAEYSTTGSCGSAVVMIALYAAARAGLALGMWKAGP